MKSSQSYSVIVLLLLGLTLSRGVAAFEIVIDQGVENALPIAVVPFAWSQSASTPPEDIAQVIRQDLARSGRFNAIPPQDMPSQPTSFDQINFSDWRRIGMENVVVGNVKLHSDGTYEVTFRLVDVYRGTQIAGYSIRTRAEQLRYTAHQVADIIYEKLTGIRGAFATRIAYITVEKQGDKKKTHRLEIADADGHSPQVLLKSSDPLMSPRWAPDGRRIAYVSFEGKNSAVYIQDVYSGKRHVVASHSGINSAPAWAPDGRRLALTLSKDGNPEIYILHLDNKLLQRVTNNNAIDTEPTWAPDGKTIYFTSDRGGSPQIYKTGTDGPVERVTFEGSYNARPVLSPDGKQLAMVRGGNGYHIALKDLQSGRSQVLTDGQLDESPSFAPNGSMIIYATTQGQNGVLAAVSADGQVTQRLDATRGDVREPDWGPFQD